jgi:hypothetical protein
MSNTKLHRIIEIQRELDLRKALYAEYDALVMELASEGFVSSEVDGLVLSLEDAFASGTNTGWTSAAVRRFSVSIETKEKAQRREARLAKKAGGE